jgi:hypothetical protein
MEKLLTNEELLEVAKKSINYPVFDHPVIILGSKNYETVVGKSPIHNLIMVLGNDDTGFQHINKRHGYKYEYTQWKKDKPNELGVPTSFSEKELLFLSWLKIVDAVYRNENLNIEDNNRKEDFDLFVGELESEDKKYKCRLLLYKNTKIIHNIIPVIKNRSFNKKKPPGFHFVKGEIRCKLDFDNEKETLIIPYLNNEKKVVFQIDIIRDMIIKEELWILSCIKGDKVFRIPAEIKTTETRLEDRILHYRFFGLEDVEKEIGRINKMTVEELKKKCNQL